MRKKKAGRKLKLPTFGSRVKASMLTAGLSVELVAEKLEVTPQVVRRWRRDREMHLSAKHLIELALILNVRAHWLGTGEGPPQRFNSSSYTESEMLDAFRALGPDERRLLRDVVGVIMKYREG